MNLNTDDNEVRTAEQNDNQINYHDNKQTQGKDANWKLSPTSVCDNYIIYIV